MKVLIIEDEAPAAKQLTKLLTKLDPSVSQYLSEIFVARERVADFKTWLGG